VTLAEQLTGMVLFVTAAVGFVRRAERGADLLTRWLAIAATLAAFSRLNYFLFPSLYSPWFYTGDVLRLTSFVAVLTGAAAELLRTQRDLAAAAALEERRRIARDIHDGVAQDLAFVVQQGRRLLRRGDVPGLWPLVAAAQGALDESRHAVAALRRPSGRPLPDALAATAQEIAGREGAAVETDLAAGVSVPADTEEALLRIVREATINAIRHGRASVVRIELREHPRLRVAVIDDGRGFDVDAARRGPGRMGLASMAERAQAIGAELSITSVEGSGSRVEVQLR
jgi:signal transduction histidine kinase